MAIILLSFQIVRTKDIYSDYLKTGHPNVGFQMFLVFECPVLGSSLYCFERVPLDICSENRKFKIMTKLEKILAKSEIQFLI